MVSIHSDYLEYEVTDDTPVAEEIPDEMKSDRMDEVLAVLVAVESVDEQNPDYIVENAEKEIASHLDQLDISRVFLYPYAHLSSDLASPEIAVDILKDLESVLKDNYKVKRAPFGYYKAFKISGKGHPISELSKSIVPSEKEEKEKTREDVIEDIESEYYILTPEGEETKVNLEDESFLEELNNGPLKKFIESEEIKGQPKEEPPSIKEMKRLELVDYESASDSGHFRFYPKGALLFDLLKEWADEIAINELDSMEIDTPILYDWNQPDIRDQGGSFHERHYSVSVPDNSDKEFVLRFAGDFGLFRIMKDSNISYKNLPMNIYEFSKSFRYEKQGELSGLRRLRGFHMPDIHSFTENVGQGWDVYEDIYRSYNDLADGTGVEFAVAFRVVKEFYEKNKDKIIEMLRYSEKPAFIEVLSEMKHYWAVKHEFQGIDSVNGNLQLSTVQLDVEDAERYGITYTDKNNEEQGCIICHSSIGSIERWIYAILEEALKKDKPMFPVWLSPTQVRVIPVKNENKDYAKSIMEELEYRVDMDERDESVGKKIREAEKEWIPYTIVVGPEEEKEQTITVRIREKDSKEVKMNISDLKETLNKKTKGKPYKELKLPKKLSKRPRFVG